MKQEWTYEPYEVEHIAKIRALAPECMVLLKSDGSFPLEAPGKVALYGSGARHTIKGGRGSADTNVKYFPTVEDGLEHAGFEITTKVWLDAYDEEKAKARVKFRAWLKEKIAAEGMDTLMENLSIVIPEPEYDLPLDGAGDTAIYVLARWEGESADRLDCPGDISLTETEIRDILTLQEKYSRFLLVLNTASMVDLSPIVEQVHNILLLSQTGMTVGDSLADVVLGRAFPSGKLADSWYAWADRPTIGEFGGRDDVRYREGIYVGYRYFDSVGREPLFPFGFGLSYTGFALRVGKAAADGAKISVPVTVRNTGKRPGKEIVQLYVSIPEGRLDQPRQVLAAFAKTGEIAPGGEERVTLSFSLEELAGFDTERCLRILEAGDYTLRVGDSSRHTRKAGVVRLDGEAVVERVSHVGGETDFDDWKPGAEDRARADAMWARLEQRGLDIEAEDGGAVLTVSAGDIRETRHQPPAIDPKALELARSLPDEELAYLCTGAFEGEGSKSTVGDAALTVASAAGETTARFKAHGVENLVMADGGTGLRLCLDYGVDENGVFPLSASGTDGPSSSGPKETLELLPEPIQKALLAMYPDLDGKPRTGEVRHQYCTALPVAAAVAQSWSGSVGEALGALVADEMDRFGIHIWLAPGMNIHRDPLCGRNFEYYSEDPLLSGRMAVGVISGVREDQGRAVTVKHFICNNQETNRFRMSSMVNERALRDIYAKGFEIAVKEARPRAFMSSYNLLNGVHTSERYDLLETLLRGEWGFGGIVMSDFLPGDESASDKTNKYPKFRSAPSVRAGLDLLMPGGIAHYENVLNALRDGTLKREEAEVRGARMIGFAWNMKRGGTKK